MDSFRLNKQQSNSNQSNDVHQSKSNNMKYWKIYIYDCWYNILEFLIFSSWWFWTNYLILNNESFYNKYQFEYIDRFALQFEYLLLHFFMLILISSSVRPYRVLYQLIFKKNKSLFLIFFILIIIVATLLELPYIFLRDKLIAKSEYFTNEEWCKYGNCHVWTLSHIIDYYMYCTLLPFLLFIVWWLMEYFIFSRCCKHWSVYYGRYHTKKYNYIIIR